MFQRANVWSIFSAKASGRLAQHATVRAETEDSAERGLRGSARRSIVLRLEVHPPAPKCAFTPGRVSA